MRQPSADVHVVADLGTWRPQWDALVDRSPLPSPFMRSWWLTGAGGPNRRFVLVASGDRLLGGLPVEEHRKLGLWRVGIMTGGQLCPDHMDLLSDAEDLDVTVDALRGWVERPGTRLADLGGLAEASRLTAVLPGLRRMPCGVAPWTPLPPDPETYRAGLSSPFRRQLRRAAGRLVTEGAGHRVRRGGDALDAIATLHALHRAQWGDRSNFLPEFERFSAACRLGVEADEVAVHEVAQGDTVVSSMVTFEVARRVSLYQSARSTDPLWNQAATVMMSEIIADACRRGFAEVDFLRGDEAYKHRFAPHRREIVRLTGATGMPARAVQGAQAIQVTALSAAERVVRGGRAKWAARKA